MKVLALTLRNNPVPVLTRMDAKTMQEAYTAKQLGKDLFLFFPNDRDPDIMIRADELAAMSVLEGTDLALPNNGLRIQR